MANVTITSDGNLEDFLSGLNNGENVTVDDGATVIIDKTPSKLIGRFTISYGKVIIDGENISQGSIINYVGEFGEVFQVDGRGKIECKGDWRNLGTFSSISSVSGNKRVIELGSSGLDIYDGDKWVSPFMIVSADSGYYCVIDKTQLGSNDVLEADIKKDFVVEFFDSNGDITFTDFVWDFKDNWDESNNTTDNNKATIYFEYLSQPLSFYNVDRIKIWRTKEFDHGPLGVYYLDIPASVIVSSDFKPLTKILLGNAVSAGTDYIENFKPGIQGRVFSQLFGNTTINFSNDSSFGFVPNDNAQIYVPNIVFSSATIEDYENGNATPLSSTDEHSLFEFKLSGGGDVYFTRVSFNNALYDDKYAFEQYIYEVGAFVNIGAYSCAKTPHFERVVLCNNPSYKASATYNCFGNLVDVSVGCEVEDCLILQPQGNNVSFGADTSIGPLKYYKCILSSPGPSDTVSGTNNRLIRFVRANDIDVDTIVYFGPKDYDNSWGDTPIYMQSSSNATLKNLYIAHISTYEKSSSTVIRTFEIADSKDVYISGLRYFQDSIANNYKVYLQDSSKIKIRCAGTLWDKIDQGSNRSSLFYLSGICSEIDFARLFFKNGTGYYFIYTYLASRDISIKNCSSSSDTGFRIRSSSNLTVKSSLGAGARPGDDTQGWENYLPSSRSKLFHDHFMDETKGNIVFLAVYPDNESNEFRVIQGNPQFDKSGRLKTEPGDIVELEMPYKAYGHTGFTGKVSFIRGSGDWYADECNDLDFFFQYAIGDNDWNGTWLDLRDENNLLNIDTTNMETEGVKLKFRLENTGNDEDVTFIFVETTTSLEAQYNSLIPIDQNFVNLKIKVLDARTNQPIEGAMVYIKGNGGEYDGQEIIKNITSSSGIVETQIKLNSSQEIVGKVRKGTAFPYYKPTNIIGTISETNGLDLNVLMIPDY